MAFPGGAGGDVAPRRSTAGTWGCGLWSWWKVARHSGTDRLLGFPSLECEVHIVHEKRTRCYKMIGHQQLQKFCLLFLSEAWLVRTASTEHQAEACGIRPMLGACDMTSRHVSTPTKYDVVWCGSAMYCIGNMGFPAHSAASTRNMCFNAKPYPLCKKGWSVVCNLWVPSTICAADKGKNLEPRVVGAGLLMNLCNLKHLKFIQKVQGRTKGPLHSWRCHDRKLGVMKRHGHWNENSAGMWKPKHIAIRCPVLDSYLPSISGEHHMKWPFVLVRSQVLKNRPPAVLWLRFDSPSHPVFWRQVGARGWSLRMSWSHQLQTCHFSCHILMTQWRDGRWSSVGLPSSQSWGNG